MTEVRVLGECGSHLLIMSSPGCAIVERRNGKIYGVRDGDRDGFPETPQGITDAVAGRWRDEAEARRDFARIARGQSLAKRIW